MKNLKIEKIIKFEDDEQIFKQAQDFIAGFPVDILKRFQPMLLIINNPKNKKLNKQDLLQVVKIRIIKANSIKYKNGISFEIYDVSYKTVENFGYKNKINLKDIKRPLLEFIFDSLFSQGCLDFYPVNEKKLLVLTKTEEVSQ